MYQVVDLGDSQFVHFVLKEGLVATDVEEVISNLDQLTGQSNIPINLMLEIQGASNIVNEENWQRFISHAQKLKNFGKLALVGDRDWERWWTENGAPVHQQDINYFLKDRLDEAGAWLSAH